MPYAEVLEIYGGLYRIRTCDLLLRRQALYPTELIAHEKDVAIRSPLFCQATGKTGQGYRT